MARRLTILQAAAFAFPRGLVPLDLVDLAADQREALRELAARTRWTARRSIVGGRLLDDFHGKLWSAARRHSRKMADACLTRPDLCRAWNAAHALEGEGARLRHQGRFEAAREAYEVAADGYEEAGDFYSAEFSRSMIRDMRRGSR